MAANRQNTVVLDTRTKVVRTLFLKLDLASEYSSHFKDKAMPNFGVIYPVFYSFS
jgi:hypothetical protein